MSFLYKNRFEANYAKMKFYLSSFKLGSQVEDLLRLIPKNKIGYVRNALDFTSDDPEKWERFVEQDMGSLRNLGLEVDLIDLKDFFGRQDELKSILQELGAVFVCGGNVFILRQAMKLSGFDQVLYDLRGSDFLYSGYSAGVCVLSPNLRPYQVASNPEDLPYPECSAVIWDGLNFIDYAFMPHYESDHSESTNINKEIEFCKENNIPFRAIRDGDVVIIE